MKRLPVKMPCTSTARTLNQLVDYWRCAIIVNHMVYHGVDLDEANAWLTRYRRFWNDSLDHWGLLRAEDDAKATQGVK